MSDLPPSSQQFPKELRLRRQRDFDRVYRQGKVLSNATLVIHTAPNELAYSRLGLSISRKVGSAVVRNRWKRLIREAFRCNRSQLPSGFDFLVRPRKGAVCNYAAIVQALIALAKRGERSI